MSSFAHESIRFESAITFSMPAEGTVEPRWKRKQRQARERAAAAALAAGEEKTSSSTTCVASPLRQ